MTEIPAGYKTAYRLIAIVRMKIKGNYGKKTKNIPFLYGKRIEENRKDMGR